MKTLRMTLLSLTALAFFLIPADSFAGPTKFRVRAKVRTPHVHVDYSYRDHNQMTRQDRQIAKRLAKYTGVSKRHLLKLRARGFRWSEIGRLYEMPRGLVRAAQSTRSWREFNRPRHKCLTHYR
jgi:hypothetical protein